MTTASFAQEDKIAVIELILEVPALQECIFQWAKKSVLIALLDTSALSTTTIQSTVNSVTTLWVSKNPVLFAQQASIALNQTTTQEIAKLELTNQTKEKQAAFLALSEKFAIQALTISSTRPLTVQILK